MLPQFPRYTCHIMMESITTAYAAQKTMAQVCSCKPQSVHGSKVVSKVLAVLVSPDSTPFELCHVVCWYHSVGGQCAGWRCPVSAARGTQGCLLVHTSAVNLLLQAHQFQSGPIPGGRWSPKHLLGGARRRKAASWKALGATTLHRSSGRCSTAEGTWMRWASVVHCRVHMASMGGGFTAVSCLGAE